MFIRQGFTLIEILVVMVIIAIAAVFALPNFTTPTEQAKALTAQNNLLAIYSAQRNYYNINNGSFNMGGGGAGIGGSGVAGDPNGVQAINTAFVLNIQDDGSYIYDCGVTTKAPPTCTAIRNNSSNLGISIVLNSPINLSRVGVANPTCNLTSSWCP